MPAVALPYIGEPMNPEAGEPTSITRVHIKNFKSIADLSLDLASINVFIGENGSGKSNILEALAFAAAAEASKLDNEFLVSRGIRVTEPRFMRSAFAETEDGDIAIDVHAGRGLHTAYVINTSGDIAYPKWNVRNVRMTVAGVLPGRDELGAIDARQGPQLLLESPEIDRLVADLLKDLGPATPITRDNLRRHVTDAFSHVLTSIELQYQKLPFTEFVVYSPELTALRTFEKEGQILPLGVRGEGLLKLLRVMATEDHESWTALRQNLELLDWLSDIDIDQSTALLEQSLRIKDRFVAKSSPPLTSAVRTRGSSICSSSSRWS